MKKLSFLILFMTSLLFSYDATTGAINNIGGTCYKNTSCEAPGVIYDSCESALGVANYTGPIIGGGGVTYCTPPPAKMGGKGSVTFCETSSATCPPSAPTVTGELTLDTGTKIIHFSDDATMYILPDGTALTWDIDGNDIENREYNGAVPALATFQENQAFDPNANKKYLDISFNGLPVFLIQKNGTVGFHGGQMTPISALIPYLAMIAVSPKTVSGSGDSISTSPAPTAEHPNAQVVNIEKLTFDNMDFSEYEKTATTTPQQIPETNLLYEKIMDATRKQSFPTASLGDTVIYENSDPTSYVNVNPDTLEVASVQPDKSITEITFDKNSFANAYNADTGVVFTTTTTSPPSINSDGTTSVTTTITNQGFITSQTTVTTDANGTTSFVTVTDPTAGVGGGITSSAGVPQSIDLSGVTSRLDKISNQLTKQNDYIDKMDKAVVGDFPHGIPSDASSADWTSWATTWDNLKSDFDSVGTKGDELRNLVNGGFSMSLTGGTIDTCPYNSTIDLLGSPIAVSFDLCKVFSPMRVILYTMFYLLFVFSMISFFIKSLFRLV